jgi:hypothetical protein
MVKPGRIGVGRGKMRRGISCGARGGGRRGGYRGGSGRRVRGTTEASANGNGNGNGASRNEAVTRTRRGIGARITTGRGVRTRSVSVIEEMDENENDLANETENGKARKGGEATTIRPQDRLHVDPSRFETRADPPLRHLAQHAPSSFRHRRRLRPCNHLVVVLNPPRPSHPPNLRPPAHPLPTPRSTPPRRPGYQKWTSTSRALMIPAWTSARCPRKGWSRRLGGITCWRS